MTSADQTWVKLYRKITEWEWYGHPPTRDLFIHLLLTVNHKPSRYMGCDIPAGAAVYGRKELAVLLGFSEKNIRTALEHLKSTNEVAIKTTNKFTVIQILKWDDYQASASTSANNRPTTGQQPATDKELKNIRNKEIEGVPVPDRYRERFNDFVLDRKERKEPMTTRAMTMLVNRLEEYSKQGHNPIELLNTAIEHGWKTVYLPKPKISLVQGNKKPTQDTRKTVTDEEWDALLNG